MKYWILLLCLLNVLFSCEQQQKENNAVSNYFARTDSGLQTGNIKMIPITTGKGNFPLARRSAKYYSYSHTNCKVSKKWWLGI